MTQINSKQLFITPSVTALVLALSASAWAGPVADVQSEVAQSYDSYYVAISKNKTSDPRQLQKAADETVGAAGKKLAEAASREQRETLEKIARRQNAPPPGKESRSLAGGSISFGVPSESNEPAPSVVLDGSGVPKELSFPSRAKSSIKPAKSKQ